MFHHDHYDAKQSAQPLMIDYNHQCYHNPNCSYRNYRGPNYSYRHYHGPIYCNRNYHGPNYSLSQA